MFKFWNSSEELCQHIITARKRSLRRLCFYTCLSFCPQGCLVRGGLPQCMLGYHPPGPGIPRSQDQAPPRPGTPPEPDTPPGTRHPRLCSACWEIRSTSGRYASYWNAILLFLVFMRCEGQNDKIIMLERGHCTSLLCWTN